ncbi:guanylin-like [Centropristis striata]|uniref:guanylin-like n=1 Tax=Centropristis striata TaxID=184440 RepID=UPI0027DFB1A3|nr:guanylin-like [Centropristis striata]
MPYKKQCRSTAATEDSFSQLRSILHHLKMRVLSVVLVLVLCACTGALGVQVKVGDMTFPLEAVKQLKELTDLDDNVSPHLAETSIVAVCSNPILPQVFRPVCQERGAGIVFSTLMFMITPVDPCEICAYPACTGCMI